MFRPVVLLSVMCAAAGFVALASVASATVIGPGDQAGTSFQSWDPSYGFPVWTFLDASSPQTLAAGTYQASTFDHEIVSNNGTIQPFVGTFDTVNGYIVPLAAGSVVSTATGSAFVSTAFGGSDTFTLAAPTAIYAGFAWEPTTAGVSPVRYANIGSGNLMTARYSTAMPVAGVQITQLSGHGQFEDGWKPWKFDFSVTVVPAPEPGTLVLLGSALLGLLAYAWRRRR